METNAGSMNSSISFPFSKQNAAFETMPKGAFLLFCCFYWTTIYCIRSIDLDITKAMSIKSEFFS